MVQPQSSRRRPPSAPPYLLPGSYTGTPGQHAVRPTPNASSPAYERHESGFHAESDITVGGYEGGDRSWRQSPANQHPYEAPPVSRLAPPYVSLGQTSPGLPHFEAALARSRGSSTVSYQPSTVAAPQPVPYPQSPYHQPSYHSVANHDPNHPEINISMHRSPGLLPRSTISYARGDSRSPTPPLMDDYDEKNQRIDIESPLIQSVESHGYGGLEDPPSQWRYSADGELNEYEYAAQEKSMTLKVDGERYASTQHFGEAPAGRVGRRNKHAQRQLKEVTLGDRSLNNFVIDAKIPTRLAQCMPVKGVEEQSTTRYTAITSLPDDVPLSGFRLRQNMYDPPRQTEIFVVITLYNEDAVLFCRTLYGVMKNISHLCSRKNSRVWGKDGWKKIVVCIVADGRKAVNPRVLDCLAALGVYQEGVMTNMVQNTPVKAHLFEYTSSFALDSDLHFKYPDKGIVPCQIIFCLKEKNARKINSHRWFLNGLAPLLSPNVVILLDAGTAPGPKSLYYLWKAFDRNSNVGGACGEIAIFKGKAWRGLLNPLVAAQNSEYKFSNCLDKPMESVFGYCSVLPGAFSAYRYIALQNDAQGKGPLASYFRGEEMLAGKSDTFTANIRGILCYELVAKAKARWVLKYVRQAVGETDCPDGLSEFISQRRRWLNGSFMAAVYSLLHIRQMLQSGHSVSRKTALLFQSVYNAVSLLFTWFALGNFYIFFVILTSSLESTAFNIKNIIILNKIAQALYLGTVIACFQFSMGNRPQGSPWKYRAASYIFAILTVYMIVCAALCVVKAVSHIGEPIYAQMIVSLISTYGVFVVSSLMALDPWHLVTSYGQYILFSPIYINILNVYAFSNLHDLSWGTKGVDKVQEDDLGAVKGVGRNVQAEVVTAQVDIDVAYQDALDNIRLKRAHVDKNEQAAPKQGVSEQEQKDIYANFRTNLLLLWSLSNALLASVILAGTDASATFEGSSSRTGVYMLVILIFVAGMSLFRLLGATAYYIVTLFGG